MTNKKALIVGRFQPFHLGHLHLINEALKRADSLTIAIGSSNVTDVDNPLSYKTRLKMLKKVIEKENLQDKITKIVPSPDVPNDKKWVEELAENAGHFDIVIGNNTWTNECLKEAGYKVVEIPYLDRTKYQGKIVREKMRNGEEWRHLVPKYLIEFTDIHKIK